MKPEKGKYKLTITCRYEGTTDAAGNIYIIDKEGWVHRIYASSPEVTMEEIPLEFIPGRIYEVSDHGSDNTNWFTYEIKGAGVMLISAAAQPYNEADFRDFVSRHGFTVEEVS